MVALRRWIATDGKIGACPEDYNLFKAAQWMNVAPWKLAKKSIWWRERAIKFINAEGEGMKLKEQHR